MKSSKKFVAVFSVALLALTSLAACKDESANTAPATQSAPSQRATTSPTPSPTPTRKSYTPADWYAAWSEPQGELVYSTHPDNLPELTVDFYARKVTLTENLYEQRDQEDIDNGKVDVSDVVPELKAGESFIVVDAVATPSEDLVYDLYYRNGGGVYGNPEEGSPPFFVDFGVGAITSTDVSRSNSRNLQDKGLVICSEGYDLVCGLANKKRPYLADFLGEPSIVGPYFVSGVEEGHEKDTDSPLTWKAGTSVIRTSLSFPTGRLLEDEGGILTYSYTIGDPTRHLCKVSDLDEPDGQIQNYVLPKCDVEVKSYAVKLDLSDLL